MKNIEVKTSKGAMRAEVIHEPERPGSGDGERESLISRQMSYEPFPAFFLLCAINPRL